MIKSKTFAAEFKQPLAVRVSAFNKSFANNNKKALNAIDLTAARGEMVALIGASGSGKSTLLRSIAGLVVGDANQESSIEVLGKNVQRAGKLSSSIREVRSNIGFVFQQFNLVDRSSVILNVLTGCLHQMPTWRSLFGIFMRPEIDRGIDALTRVGIAECATQRASTLSGGQQQRAAIARALVQGAQIVLADEPIASLDPESSRRVMEILSKINKENGVTVIVSLHQVDIAMKYCQRVVALRDGSIIYDGAAKSLTPELLHKLYGAEVNELLPTCAKFEADTDVFMNPVTKKITAEQASLAI